MFRSAPRVLLTVLLLVAGCGRAAQEAAVFRVLRGLYRAGQLERAERLGGVAPDSASLMRIHAAYIKPLDPALADLARSKGGPRTDLERELLQAVGRGEIHAATLALGAGRADLALERCQALAAIAQGDTAVTRQADIVVSGALRRLGRHEEAIQAMKAMMAHYPPRPPDSTGVEDVVLGLPTTVVEVRKEMGDEAGASRELDAAERYYRGLLAAGPLDPRLEGQIRSRLVHTALERGDRAAAVAGLDTLETLVSAAPAMSPLIPEIRYTRAKVMTPNVRDPGPVIAALERVAFEFPESPFAAPALFDAAVIEERAGRLADARDGYAAVAARFPTNAGIASTALMRQAMVEDRLGAWETSKSLLESIPAKYPRTTAAARAPLAVAEHYARVGDRQGLRASLRRAVDVYTRMIESDSTSAGVIQLRWSKFRAFAGLEDADGALRALDELVAKHPKAPLTGDALLIGANIAEKNKLYGAARTYLDRYLLDYPGSSEAPSVRQRLRSMPAGALKE
jgi:tetratricopeptide (TPR) repeat protein